LFSEKNSWQKLYNGLQKYIGLTIESVAHPWCSKIYRSLCFKALDFSSIVTAVLKEEVCSY